MTPAERRGWTSRISGADDALTTARSPLWRTSPTSSRADRFLLQRGDGRSDVAEDVVSVVGVTLHLHH